MIKKYIVLIVSFISMSSLFASGELDTTFGTSGLTLTQVSRRDTLNAMQVQPDNKIIIVGATETSCPELFLARYTANGALDTSTFNSSGSMPGTQTLLVGFATEGQAAVLQPYDDKIVVAGFALDAQNDMIVARFNTDGSIDTTFNTTGYVTQTIGDGAIAYAVGLQSTGDIVVAGASVNNESPNFTLARFTSSGTLDATFGTGGITTTVIGVISYIQAMAIVPSGYYQDYIIVLGNVDEQITIARYTPSGTLDATFGTAGLFMPNVGNVATGYSLILDASDNILIAGSASISSVNQSLLIRCTQSGTLDLTFNGTGYVTTPILYGSEFYSLILQEDDYYTAYDGYILAAGYAIGRLTYEASLARYNPDGSLDTSFGTNGTTTTVVDDFAYTQALGLQSDGESITAGQSDGTFLLARYTA